MSVNRWIKIMLVGGSALAATAVMASDKGADASAEKGMQAMMAKHFAKVDSNGDKVVSHDEMLARTREKFNGFDKDKDGFITLAELPKVMPMPEHMKKRMADKKARMASKMKERGEKSEKSRAMPDEKRLEHRGHRSKTRIDFMARTDRDKDERVSFDEFSVRSIRMFKRHDANGDGRVTIKEMKNAKKKHHRHEHKHKMKHKMKRV